MSLFNKIIDLQKLDAAWERVRRNRPAAGVDQITADQFDANKKAELKELHAELLNGTYHPHAVRQVVLQGESKQRTVSLYCMRDKVIQLSAAQELNRIYEDRFPRQVYAYRSNKSALNAVNDIDAAISTGKYSHLLKLDIASYFDSIEWPLLEDILSQRILEEPVILLIGENVCAGILNEDGEVTAPVKGIHQGSSLAPVLSNIFLMDVDKWIAENSSFYARYSDDMLILGANEQELESLWNAIEQKLIKLHLSLRREKSGIFSLADGADFLGYHFDINGKSIPVKAEKGLARRLENMWLDYGDITVEEKAKKALGILGGWEQYFREHRKPQSILEFTALLSSGKIQEVGDLICMRQGLENEYYDVMCYLAEKWKQSERPDLELQEYECYYALPEKSSTDNDSFGETRETLNHFYRDFIVLQSVDTATELAQAYTDCGFYENARWWMKEADRLRTVNTERTPTVPDSIVTPAGTKEFQPEKYVPKWDEDSAEKLLAAFAGREDIFSVAVPAPNKSRHFEIRMQPLTPEVVSMHLKGLETVGTYVQRSNGTVRFWVADIDVSKKVLLQHSQSSETYAAWLRRAAQVALNIQKHLRSLGIESGIEFTGNRGYHVWVLFEVWIPVRYANLLSDVIESRVKIENELTLEFFPNKTKLKPGKYGQVIQLPLGIHTKTGEYSCFYNDSMQPIENVSALCDTFPKTSLSTLKRAISAGGYSKEDTRTATHQEFDLSAYGDIPENVKQILSGCALMQYLCDKARKTQYLSHFERLSLLYVFGHAGQEGKDFLHTVMANTLNYQYQVTERFIRKLPDKPISCIKLRDQYKMITAEIGCSCVFRRMKGCYPSPVLHALSQSKDNEAAVTIPASNPLTKEKEQKVLSELNLQLKVQELTSRVLELKKQKRKLDAAVSKAEKELEKIFDSENIETMELELGLLVRRKKDEGYEWLIEI